MKGTIAVLTAFLLGAMNPALADVIHPGPREFRSSNGRFCIRVTPPIKHEQPGNCRAVLYEIKGTNRIERWSRGLPNNLSPSQMFLSDDAQFILSVGDWSESQRVLPVVVYCENWLMHAHTLESLGIESPGNMVDPFQWMDGAKLFFGPKQETFVIVLKTGYPIVIGRGGEIWGPWSSNGAERAAVLEFIQEHRNGAKTMAQYLVESMNRKAPPQPVPPAPSN